MGFARQKAAASAGSTTSAAVRTLPHVMPEKLPCDQLCRLTMLLSSLLAACVTAFAGPISFVGIAVPHLVKQLLGSARPLYVLPGCCLGGAAFCLLCDLIARSLFAPMELSISAVTAVFGAPVVIGLLLRRNREDVR